MFVVLLAGETLEDIALRVNHHRLLLHPCPCFFDMQIVLPKHQHRNGIDLEPLEPGDSDSCGIHHPSRARPSEGLMFTTESLITLIIALIAAGPGIWALIQNRKKVAAESSRLEAETQQVITETALTLVEPLRKRVELLEKQVGQQEETIEKQQAIINAQAQTIEEISRELADSRCRETELAERVRALETENSALKKSARTKRPFT